MIIIITNSNVSINMCQVLSKALNMYYLIEPSQPCEVDALITYVLQRSKVRLERLVTCPRSPS